MDTNSAKPPEEIRLILDNFCRDVMNIYHNRNFGINLIESLHIVKTIYERGYKLKYKDDKPVVIFVENKEDLPSLLLNDILSNRPEDFNVNIFSKTIGVAVGAVFLAENDECSVFISIKA